MKAFLNQIKPLSIVTGSNNESAISQGSELPITARVYPETDTHCSSALEEGPCIGVSLDGFQGLSQLLTVQIVVGKEALY